MALSNAERQRLYIRRLKAKAAAVSDDPVEDLNEESEIASPAVIEDNLLYTIDRINEHARVFKKLLKASSFDAQAEERIKTAIKRMIHKWQSVKPRKLSVTNEWPSIKVYRRKTEWFWKRGSMGGGPFGSREIAAKVAEEWAGDGVVITTQCGIPLFRPDGGSLPDAES